MAIHRWYVEPLNSWTWKRVIEGGFGVGEEDVSYERTCSDGKGHNLLEVTSVHFRNIKKSVSTESEFEAHFWHQEGGGQIEPWPPSSKRARRIRKVKKGKVKKGVPSGKAAQK